MSTCGGGLHGRVHGKPMIVVVGLGRKRDFASFSPIRTEQRRLTGIGFLGGWYQGNFPRGTTPGFPGFGCKAGFLSHQHRISYGTWALGWMPRIRMTYWRKQGWKGRAHSALHLRGRWRLKRMRSWTTLFFTIIYCDKRVGCHFGPGSVVQLRKGLDFEMRFGDISPL